MSEVPDWFPRLLAGEADAQRRFVEEMAPGMRRAIVFTLRRDSRLDAEQDADERLNDVMVRLFERDCRVLRTWRPEVKPLDTYLAMIARHAAIDHLRRRRELPVDSEALEALAADSARSDAQGAAPGDDLIRRVLARFQQDASPDDMLLLHDLYLGTDAAEIARGFGLTIDAAYKRISRVRKQLADLRRAIEEPGIGARSGRRGSKP